MDSRSASVVTFTGERTGETESLSSPESKSGEVRVQILFTSDIHGAVVDSSSVYGEGKVSTGGLGRISTLLRKRRTLYPDSITVDGGDTFQGTAFSHYYAFFNSTVSFPGIRAMGKLGYDAWNLGNHEFNWGLDFLDKEIREAEREGVKVITANFLRTGGKEYEPRWGSSYIVRDFDGVRTGVIGMCTPYIPLWEKRENWEGIEFRTFLDCWNHYAGILRKKEGCDIVVVSCHSGKGRECGVLRRAEENLNYSAKGLYYEDSYENEIACLIENSSGIDLVLGGHTHEKGLYTLRNIDGRNVPVLHSGSNGEALGAAVITYSKTEKRVLNVSPEVIDACGYEEDASFLEEMAPYVSEVKNSYLGRVIGFCDGDFLSPGLMTGPNAFLDLINKVQLWAIPEKIGAQLSFSSPLGKTQGILLPEGEIRLGQLFGLYRFENWLYCVDMKGEEIKAWLEVAAGKYRVGNGSITDGGGMYCDTLYGAGVSYELYIGNEEGDRVRNITYLGEPLMMDGHYRVVITSYRFQGGGEYIKGVQDFLGEDSFCAMEKRVLYSTEYDMEMGEDNGHVRSLLSSYIAQNGIITPSVTGRFSVYPGKSAR